MTGGLTLEIAKITHQYIDNINLSSGVSDGTSQGDTAQAFFQDYYTNADYRSNLVIGGTSLGSSKIEGVLVQYLDVKLRDLPTN